MFALRVTSATRSSRKARWRILLAAGTSWPGLYRRLVCSAVERRSHRQQRYFPLAQLLYGRTRLAGQNVGIDGLYIDDLAFDRAAMKRVRKILNRTNPNALIDLHSANQFNRATATPTVPTSIWNIFPISTVCGLARCSTTRPLSRFLADAGFGYSLRIDGRDAGKRRQQMARHDLRHDLSPIRGQHGQSSSLEILGQFRHAGQRDDRLLGFQQSCQDQQRQNTCHHLSPQREEDADRSRHMGRLKDATVNLNIDWKQLGLNPAKVTLHAPAIEGYQTEQSWKMGEPIVVPEEKAGWSSQNKHTASVRILNKGLFSCSASNWTTFKGCCLELLHLPECYAQ